MEALRIVHISDLHVGQKFVENVPPILIHGFSATSRFSMERLEEHASFNNNSGGTNCAVCCIVSGDLTAFGDGQEFENAITYLGQGHGARGLGLKYHSPKRWDGVLGNHDIWGGGSSLTAWFCSHPKKEYAERHSGLKANVRRGEFDFGLGPESYIDVNRLRVRFYFLDSTLPGWNNIFARGRVNEAHLKDLETLVVSDQEGDRSSLNEVEYCLRIAVLHHPLSRPWNGSLLQTTVLENGPKVLEFLERLNFGLVLCGHEHEFSECQLGPSGIFFEMTAGTALQTIYHGGPNSFLIMDIASNSIHNPNPLIMGSASPPTVPVHFKKMIRKYLDLTGSPGVPFNSTVWDRPIRIVQL